MFRPFFVSLNLPYSVVRGEQLVLQVIVFNYMNKETDVTVTLPASDEYMSIVIDGAGNTQNVKKVETVVVRVSLANNQLIRARITCCSSNKYYKLKRISVIAIIF